MKKGKKFFGVVCVCVCVGVCVCVCVCSQSQISSGPSLVEKGQKNFLGRQNFSVVSCVCVCVCIFADTNFIRSLPFEKILIFFSFDTSFLFRCGVVFVFW